MKKRLAFIILALGLCLALLGCNDDGSGGTASGEEVAEQLSAILEGVDAALPMEGAEGEKQELAHDARQSLDGNLVIVPVPGSQKARYEAKGDGPPWTPLVALGRPENADGPPVAYEVSERTEFWAVFIDRESKYLGKVMVFSWFMGREKRPFAQPTAGRVTRVKGYPYPIAWAYFWSDPASGGSFMRGLGLRSITSQDEWNNSRCFGPRSVEVQLLEKWRKGDGKHKVPVPQEGDPLAGGTVHLLEPGVQVIR